MPYQKHGSKRPGPAAVVVGSVALFVVLFALIAFQVGAGASAETTPATSQKTATATDAESSLTSHGGGEEGGGGDEGGYEEPYAEEPRYYEEEAYAEPSYAEPEYPEEETYAEPYVEEIPVEEAPPVTTGGS